MPSRNIVITAASSGIGRATAEAFAACDATLILAARGEQALEAVAGACRAKGAKVYVHPADVTDAEAVRRLAERAVTEMETIDLWASIAGVGALGLFQNVPMASHEQTIRTNLIGHMNEAHAVLPTFLRQGRGVFVNMISLGGFASTPYAAAYGASKFGLKGFSEALRGELAEHPDIHVCDVYPPFIDTPGIGHAANYTGRKLSAPPPVVDARRVAAAIVRLTDRPKPTTMVGSPTLALRLGHALAPDLTARSMYHFMAAYFARADQVAETDGNLFDAPDEPQPIDGNLRATPAKRVSMITAAGLLGAVGLFAITRFGRHQASRRRTMDRNGDDWTGDQVDAEAKGEGAAAGSSGNRADDRSSTEPAAPRQRSIATAAEGSVKLNDDGAVPTTTAGSGDAGESD